MQVENAFSRLVLLHSKVLQHFWASIFPLLDNMHLYAVCMQPSPWEEVHIPFLESRDSRWSHVFKSLF